MVILNPINYGVTSLLKIEIVLKCVPRYDILDKGTPMHVYMLL